MFLIRHLKRDTETSSKPGVVVVVNNNSAQGFAALVIRINKRVVAAGRATHHAIERDTLPRNTRYTCDSE